MALFFRSNFARNARVMDRGHINQIASGQRNVAGDARAFLRDGLFGNLDQTLLAFRRQVPDGSHLPCRLVARLSAHGPPPPAAPSASPVIRSTIAALVAS